MKPVVLIPSYNTGKILPETIEAVLDQFRDVSVVIDGSTDGSTELISDALRAQIDLHEYAPNKGKGAAVFLGAQRAVERGFTHLLTIDSDGQHPAEQIPEYLSVAAENPQAVIYGRPVFDADAPAARVQGRKISNQLVEFETRGGGIDDVLFGMRCYPIDALLSAMEETRFGRRYDFDTEVAVRLAWAGVPAINLPTPVRYLRPEDGGISHFRYLRDNLLLGTMHARLLAGWFQRA